MSIERRSPRCGHLRCHHSDQDLPRRLIDPATNAVVWSWDSTAFGVAPPSVETVKFNLRFPGQVYDDLTKQHYNLNRYYNPELGRYMEADPERGSSEALLRPSARRRL